MTGAAQGDGGKEGGRERERERERGGALFGFNFAAPMSTASGIV